MRLAHLAALLLALIAIGAPVRDSSAAEDGARVILVLDASGSMWGQIDGKTKMDIARETVRTILGSWRSQDELGLVVYGHRSKGDCNDIETVVQPGPLDATAMMGVIDALNPKGKTPMTEAVRRAAEALRYTEQTATVILVSDGEETCNADPCAVAAELEAAGIGLTVHAVGFDINDAPTKAQLQCFADKTGGTFTTASNASELAAALAATVAAAQSAPVTTEIPPAGTATSLTGTARLAPGMPNLEDADLRWDVYAVGADGKPIEPPSSSYGGQLLYAAKPGTYIVRTSIDFAVVATPVTVEAGKPTVIDVVLDAGQMMVKITRTMGGPPEAKTRFDVMDATGTRVNTFYGGEQTHYAAAGTWTLRASVGSAAIEGQVEVKAGETVSLNLSMNAGRIVSHATLAPGGAPVMDHIRFDVVRGTDEIVQTDYDPAQVFDLAAGHYRLRATSGLAIKETEFDIAAGAQADVTVSLDAGVLTISAPGSEQVEVLGAAADQPRLEVVYDETSRRAIPAGHYLLRASNASGAVIAEKEIDIAAGQSLEVSLP